MFPPASDTHSAVLVSLAAFLLGVIAFLVSLWAAIISRTVARRTTEPILTPHVSGPLSTALAELRNTGAVTATSTIVELIERRKRASATLHVSTILDTRDSRPIRALDFPRELIDELRENHIAIPDPVLASFNTSRIRTNDPNPAKIAQDPIEADLWERKMAHYLMTRQGGQRIIVSCSIPDKPRQLRIYKVSKRSQLQMCKIPPRLHAWYLRLRYGKNAVLRPLPEMPSF